MCQGVRMLRDDVFTATVHICAHRRLCFTYPALYTETEKFQPERENDEFSSAFVPDVL